MAGLTTRWAKPDNTLDESTLPPTEPDQPAEPATNWLVLISLLIVIGLTFWLQDYLQKQSAVISSSTDSNGQILAQSEYAKGKVLQRLEQNEMI